MADGESLSLDAAVNLLAQPVEAPPEEEKKQEPEAQAEAAPQPEPEPEAQPEAEAEAEVEEPEAELEEEPAPQIDPPRSWSKEDAAVWQSLTPEVQEVVARREADRDRAVALAHQEKSELTNVVTQIAERYQQWAPQLQQIAVSEQQAFDAKWGDVDWPRFAREDFENFQTYRAEYEAEKLALQDRQEQQQALEAEAQRAAELGRRRFLAEEGERLQSIAPELASSQERRAEVGRFLIEQGFQPGVLQDISAVELALAHDAMKWREAQRKTSAQAKAPPKPTPAPKAVPVRGAGVVSKGRELQGLETKLTKTGGLDDAVALLVARGQSRKR